MVQNITGRNIAKSREAKELTQDEFAAKLQILGWDVSRGTIAKIEAQVRAGQ